MQGLTELRAALRELPHELTKEASDIVNETADRAKTDIVAAYPEVTGALKRGVKRGNITKAFVAGAIVVSTAPHANIFEHGSQTRKTASGAPNPLPPGRVFVPIVVRARRAMQNKLVDLVRKAGFVVSGG
jgi:hypothetical protein